MPYRDETSRLRVGSVADLVAWRASDEDHSVT